MKKGNHPLKMYGKSPLKDTGAYGDNRFIGKSAAGQYPVDSGNEGTRNLYKGANESEDQKTSGVSGVDRPYTFKDYFGKGQNLSETGPFSGLKKRLEDSNSMKQAVTKYITEKKAEKGKPLNKIVDTGVELQKQDYTLPKDEIARPSNIPENDKSSINSGDFLPNIPEIDESSIDLSAFNQVSDGYNRAMMRSKLYQMSNATDLQQIQQAVQPQDQMGMQDQIGMQPDPNDIYNVSGRNNDTLTNAAFKMFGSKKHRNQ